MKQQIFRDIFIEDFPWPRIKQENANFFRRIFSFLPPISAFLGKFALKTQTRDQNLQNSTEKGYILPQ